MNRRWNGALSATAILLAACSSDASGDRTPTLPGERQQTTVDLPKGDTGAIDLASLEGRMAFGVGTDMDTTEVFVIGADGSELTRLTHNKVADFDPSWSPDGHRIVFRSQRDGNDEIYVMNADGTRPRNLHP